jgi:predicted aspartyl protease
MVFLQRRKILKLLLLAAASWVGRSNRSSAGDEKLNADREQNQGITFADGATSTGWLDFDMPDGRHIVLTAQLNGVAADVVLDSGAGGIVLDRGLADRLGLKAQQGFTAVGVTGSAQGAVAQGVTITLNNLTVRTSQSTIFDLTQVSAAAGRPVLAIVGRDLLGTLVADIDFPRKRLAFYGRDGEPRIQGGTDIPLTVGNFRLREIPVSIEGRPPIQAVFDLGSDTPVYLSPAYAAQAGLLAGKATSTSLSAGVEGMEENRVAVVETVKIGHTLVHEVPIEVPRNWNQSADAFVGLPILRRFRLVIDFSHDRLTIVPDADAVNDAFRKDRSGIGAMPSNGRLTIIHIAEHSPAEAAGLRVGDEITSINGQQIDAEYIKRRPREGSKPAGTIFSLTLKDGRNVRLVLADYF